MADDRAQLLGKILDALFEAEFCEPNEKAERAADCDRLLEQAAAESGKSVGLIKEAVLKSAYPKHRLNRLRAELPGTPPPSRSK